MIQKMSHATIYVLDQDHATDFYVNKLGFEVKVDQSLPNGFRWLTVAPKGQSELEVILMKEGSGSEQIPWASVKRILAAAALVWEREACPYVHLAANWICE
jgi:catechol 2,3-dioxygenase-like lactoylglutathione lyase family enzyme